MTVIKEQALSKSQMAYQALQHLRRRGTEDIDYKSELTEALEEKFESLGWYECDCGCTDWETVRF